MSPRKVVFPLSLLFLSVLPLFAQTRGNVNSGQPGQLVTVRGRIVDAETGAAVLDARISLIAIGGMSMGQGQTSMGSDFIFDNIPAQAMYELKVEADGYQTVQQPFQPSMGMTGYITIPIRKTKFIEVPAKGKAVSSRMLQLPPEARDAYQNGITQLYEKHDPEKSLAFFQKTLSLAPAFYEAQYNLGMAFHDLKRVAEAEAAFRDAEKASAGKYAPPQFALASMFSDRQSYPDAETMARKGLELEPKSAPGHYELARALLGQGKTDDAETEAKASLELSRDLPQNYLLLGAVSANRGQSAEAIKNLDLYLAAVPKGPTSDAVRTYRENLRQQAGLAKQEPSAPISPEKPR